MSHGENRRDTGLKVAVVGGGMCGLVVAIGLRKAGVEVDIYEAASKFGEIGAGVGLGPNAIRVLHDLEILDEILARVSPGELAPRPFLFLSGLDGHETVFDYPTPPEDAGLGIHRATFLDALVHLVDPDKTHFNKRCISLRAPLSPSAPMKINFADGSSAEADVVLGGDGIKSAVRAFVADENVDSTNGSQLGRVVFTNTYAYRALVPTEEVEKLGIKSNLRSRPHCFCGPGKHIITFPIKNTTIINVVAFTCDRSIPWGARPLPPGTPWVTQRTPGELSAEYAGWGADVTRLLSCIGNLGAPSVWAIHAVDPLLQTYVRGRAAVLGDAAHGTLPHLGAGAGQALEDALVLVRLLTHPNTSPGNVESVLKAYDLVRLPRANMVLAESTRAGEVYEGYGPSGPSSAGMRADLENRWDKVWHHDLGADVDRAVNWLVEKGIFSGLKVSI
ncbi:FAD/NAD-binding domain-containing protein [Phellopilus nigrolimitatus]|nr:FAD/NAD-binding domain-containing protein [Phellopilus nigrolimitatus]